MNHSGLDGVLGRIDHLQAEVDALALSSRGDLAHRAPEVRAVEKKQWEGQRTHR